MSIQPELKPLQECESASYGPVEENVEAESQRADYG